MIVWQILASQTLLIYFTFFVNRHIFGFKFCIWNRPSSIMLKVLPCRQSVVLLLSAGENNGLKSLTFLVLGYQYDRDRHAALKCDWCLPRGGCFGNSNRFSKIVEKILMPLAQGLRSKYQWLHHSKHQTSLHCAWHEIRLPDYSFYLFVLAFCLWAGALWCIHCAQKG